MDELEDLKITLLEAEGLLAKANDYPKMQVYIKEIIKHFSNRIEDFGKEPESVNIKIYNS